MDKKFIDTHLFKVATLKTDMNIEIECITVCFVILQGSTSKITEDEAQVKPKMQLEAYCIKAAFNWLPDISISCGEVGKKVPHIVENTKAKVVEINTPMGSPINPRNIAFFTIINFTS